MSVGTTSKSSVAVSCAFVSRALYCLPLAPRPQSWAEDSGVSRTSIPEAVDARYWTVGGSRVQWQSLLCYIACVAAED